MIAAHQLHNTHTHRIRFRIRRNNIKWKMWERARDPMGKGFVCITNTLRQHSHFHPWEYPSNCYAFRIANSAMNYLFAISLILSLSFCHPFIHSFIHTQILCQIIWIFAMLFYKQHLPWNAASRLNSVSMHCTAITSSRTGNPIFIHILFQTPHIFCTSNIFHKPNEFRFSSILSFLCYVSVTFLFCLLFSFLFFLVVVWFYCCVRRTRARILIHCPGNSKPLRLLNFGLCRFFVCRLRFSH